MPSINGTQLYRINIQFSALNKNVTQIAYVSFQLITFSFSCYFFFDFLHADYQRIRNLDSEKSRFYLWHTNTHIHTRVPFNSPNGVYAGLTHLAVCNLIIRRDSCSLCSYTVTLFRSLSLFAVYYVVNAMRIQQQ